MKKYKLKRHLKKVLTVVLAVLILGAVASLITSLVTREENEIHPTFVYGGLDSNGKYVDTKSSLVTEEFINFDELSIKVDFKSNVKYNIYFYSEDGTYMYSRGFTNNFSTFLLEDFSTANAGIVQVRIVLEPTWEKDVKEEERKISLLEKRQIINDVTICAKVNEVEEVEIIEFTTVNHFTNTETSFTCEKGMTWNVFIESSYNTDGAGHTLLSIINGKVNVPGGPQALLNVALTDTIVDGMTYTSVAE